MPQHTSATHRIRIAAPIAQCHRFFTPAGEELWVDGWSPTYAYPPTGTTESGMVFTTGSGEESLKAFEGQAFEDMIDSWKQSIDQHLPALLSAEIR